MSFDPMSNDTAIASLHEKIDDLNQQAWEVRVTDVPKSLELSQESVKLARSINYPKGLAEGLRSLGFSYVRLSKNDQAAPLLKESLSLFQFLNDLNGQAVIYEYLGIIERNWGNLGASLELLLKANEIVLQTGPPEVQITCWYQLGVTYKHLGDHENALDYLYKTLSIAKKINFPLMEAYATNIIGSIYFDNGNYEQALDCYQQGLPVRQQSNDKWGEAGSLDNIGFTYLKLNDLEKAIEYCKQSLAICRGTSDKKGEANALLHLAEIYEQAGDLKQAAAFSNESLEIRKTRGDKRGQTEVLLFLAELYKDRNDVEDDQIFEWLSGALKIAGEIKAQDLLSKAYYNLHEYYRQKGNFKESLVQLEAHFQIEKELHKNNINQKVASLEISHKAEVVGQRNKELTELNEKIEKANEELKIERSLERVRTAAMAMNQPADMLEVCKIISDQLQILDVKKVRNVQTAIFYEEKSVYMNYEYYAKHDKQLITEVNYNNHPVAEKFANQMLKGPNEVFIHGFTGKEVRDWLDYQKTTNVFIDTYLETADCLNYYWYSLGPVALGMSAYASLNENEINLFKRFRNVFELAYRRYLDIEKAQAQAREAQIEAALEKVRGRAMAIRKSDELSEVIQIIFQEMNKLGIDLMECSIATYDDTNPKDLIFWSAGPFGSAQSSSTKLQYIDHPLLIELLRDFKNGIQYRTGEYSGELLNTWWERIFVETDFKYAPKEFIESWKKIKQVFYSQAAMNHGFLEFLGEAPMAEDKVQILKRFTNVVDLTYTRYDDVIKAEAQAREAKIEAALERTRTQSMIMQHSKELDDALRVFHEQVLLLGIHSAFSFLWLPDEEKDRHIFWAVWDEDQNNSTVFKSKAINYPLDRNEPATAQCLVDWKGNEPIVSYHVPPAGVESYFAAWQELLAGVEKLKPEYFYDGLYYVEAFMKYGCFGVMVESELSEHEKKILSRFAVEFERTYTRFLDLQKAEAQARESQIELGLERVRARAMAMQKSNELAELVDTVFKELTKLHFTLDRCIIIIVDEKSMSANYWMSNPESKTPTSYNLQLKDIPYLTAIFDAWKERKIKMVYDLKGEEKSSTVEYIFSQTELRFLPDEVKAGMKNTNRIFLNSSFSNFGGLQADTLEPLSEDNLDILFRFAKVFDLTYTRFNDLQKAEGQAREAQIEAALERVRSKTMAMQRSEELDTVIKTVYSELKRLDVSFDLCFIMIFDEQKGATWWMGSPEGDLFHDGFYVQYHTHPPHLAYVKGWEERQQNWDYLLGGQIKKDWDEFVFSKTALSKLPPIVIQRMKSFESAHLSASFENFGCMTTGGMQRLSEESFSILNRFGKVFDQTYTRFNDLKQAEAQAREAKIEAALERVRAKAMAMHKSEDLKPAVATVFEELDKLNLGLIRCGIAILDKERPRGDIWITIKSDHGNTIEVSGDESLDIHPLLKGAYEAWLKLEDFSYVLQNEDLATYYQAITKTNFQQPVSATFTTGKKDQQQYYFNAVFQHGSLFAFLDTAFTDEAKMVMKRFANVFNLTYKRFLDLQKAEAQARESQIELGLERVRARAMAMQNSDELKELIGTVNTELTKLDLILDRCFIMIYDNRSMGVTWWMSNPEAPLKPVGLFVKYHEQPPYLAFIKGWKERNLKWQYILEGDVKKTWDKFLFVETELSQLPDFVIANMKANEKVYLSASFNNFGSLTLATLESLSDEHFDIMLRFAKVFDLTYTRFNDLKQAEAQAREATIEAALERVRARALAMQQPEELKDVAQVLRTEMGLLGVEELETCSIYINDESPEKAECWYALKDISAEEKKLVNDHFALDLNDTWVGRAMLQFYQSTEKKVSIVMQGDKREEWIRYCEQRSALLRGYYGEVIPDRTYHLYKFSHGAIGAAAAGEISEESWRMLSRVASVFSLAYSRFKDLTQARTDLLKLKEEKKRAEDALTELQATQKQLIQSEKMASLGELTAGIAHEIQNPLNFVNNFSDVSNELLEEMKAELEKGNAKGAKEIAADVKENLEKILHHGKRADAIVKGMLQHSRSSTGQKELTDINILAEEYLRLAYHGLRAKDKFFNARFETDLDPSIPKINIVPQEIGRVILNLINNSFYAVTEKKKKAAGGIGYEPVVTVSTRRHDPSPDGATIQIKVADNGIGIAKKDFDKIFQPFFTTKPTGQGTGLGLSLSYDIITQGHGGEIKVETKEGEGSEFTITLPMN